MSNTEKWFSETLHGSFQQSFKISEILYTSNRGLQDILIFKTPFFGRVLALDNIIQTTEADESCYHEMLSHVPIISHGSAAEILIIGGGDGGVLRETLRHKTIKTATVVEIDNTVVELCKTFFPSLSAGAFDDSRADLIITDGLTFVEKTKRKFDIIIVDSTDPVGPSIPLFSDRFYIACRKILTKRGILVCQSGVSFVQEKEARETIGRLRKTYEDAALYLTQVPTYSFGFMTLGWGSLDKQARNTKLSTLKKRFVDTNIKTRYYTPEVHKASFSLPAYMNYAA